MDELILYPLIYDDAVPMGQGDVVDGAFSFYPTGQSKGNVVYPVRQKTATEQVFFDNGFASMIILETKMFDHSEGLEVSCYLENKTDRFLSFAWSDMTMDGAALNGSGDAVVAPGMRRYVTVDVPPADLEGSSHEVSFKVSATPLSNTGSSVSPLMEQRGSYRFIVAATADPDTGTEPGDEPGTGEAPATATPSPTTIIYTTPTSAQKRNAKNGYVNKDKVNLRSGPGTKYKTVGKKIEQNTAVTLYELQDGWWFLKCGSHYGYVKADYVTQGKPKATATPSEGDGKSFTGTVSSSKAALRQSADKKSKCLKELTEGTKVTVHYKTKGKDGKTWYYVNVGKTKGFIFADLVKVAGKIPSK